MQDDLLIYSYNKTESLLQIEMYFKDVITNPKMLSKARFVERRGYFELCKIICKEDPIRYDVCKGKPLF